MAILTSPSLQKMLVSVRSMLNQPDPNNSFWTDEELMNYINEGIRRYFVEAAQSFEGAFAVIADLDIVSGVETVTLPDDCFNVRMLSKKVTDGYITLPYRNNLTEGWTTQGGTSGDTFLPYYYFRGNDLVLRPVPNFSEVGGLRLEYTQFPDTMLNGGDILTAQVSPIFRDLIEMYAVYKAKTKESLTNGSTLNGQIGQHVESLYTQFKDAVQIRSKNPTAIIPFNPEESN